MPAVQETWVLSLGWEDLLEEGIATHSRILAWRIPWTEKTCRPQFMGSQRVEQTEVISTGTVTAGFVPTQILPHIS